MKWVTDFPNMIGVVSGDASDGHFAGEVLNVELTTDDDRIDALYNINGGDFQLTANNYITENSLKGTGVIHGIVTDGPMNGVRARGGFIVRVLGMSPASLF